MKPELQLILASAPLHPTAAELKAIDSLIPQVEDWHVLQGFWYRFLVDAKIWEIKRELSTSPPAPLPGERGVETRHATSEERIVAWLREKYGV